MNRLKKYFISGLVVLAPLLITVYFLILIINFADGILGTFLEPYFEKRFGIYFRGLSILIGAYIVVLIGFFVTNILGKRVFEFFENVFVRIPLVSVIYPALKEMMVFLFSRDQLRSFQQVVLIEYPRQGIYSFGFLTNNTSSRLCEKVGHDLCNIFIPSTPSPLTGFVVMVPKKDIVFTDMSIEEAFKFIVSGGVVNPS